MVVGEVAQPVEVLVIGGGPGGYTAAARAAALGKETVLVEADRLGGVCLNVGCIPSKALITAAHDLARMRASSEMGIIAEPSLDFAATQRWKQGIVDQLRDGVARHVLKGVRVEQGVARFLDPHRVAVESGDQVTHFRFDASIIATGSRPAELPGLPIDGERVVDSTGALAFSEVPSRLVVVGGGYIGIELGIAYAKLGASVTIVEALDRLLAGFDPDLVRPVLRTLDRLSVEVRLNARAEGLDGDGLIVDGATVPADKVLVAVGRRPNTDDLQLEETGLVPDDDGLLATDEQCRTKVPHLYAIGDVTPGPALAHKAMAEGRVAAEAIAGLPSGFDQVVPLIAFTDPELAAVGLTEEEARAQGYDVRVGRARFGASGRALTLGEANGLVKVVVDAETDVVLGVHLAGPSASDLVAEATLAVETAARAEDLAAAIHPHPTLAEVVGEAALAARA